MPRRALIEKRPWLLASLIAAIGYYALKDGATPEAYLIALKGASFGLLAIYALLRHQGADTRFLAAVLALAAAGAMATDLYPTIAAFLLILEYGTAISLFLRHRRMHLAQSQKGVAVALLLLTPAIAWLLPADRAAAQTAAILGLVVGGMAACAWTSRFPRYRVGSGAVILVAAILLDIAGTGPLAANMIAAHAAWPLSYFGHFLVCTGVIQSLRARG